MSTTNLFDVNWIFISSLLDNNFELKKQYQIQKKFKFFSTFSPNKISLTANLLVVNLKQISS
jgi:hypothetical protein